MQLQPSEKQFLGQKKTYRTNNNTFAPAKRLHLQYKKLIKYYNLKNLVYHRNNAIGTYLFYGTVE